MKRILAPLLIALLTVSTFGADEPSVKIAKVNYFDIEQLLIKVVLSSEGNEKLQREYTQREKAMKDRDEAAHLAIRRGEHPDLDDLHSLHTAKNEHKRKVDDLCHRYLLGVIGKSLGDKYDVSLNGNQREDILYTDIPIEDVTALIKQKLLKALPAN